MYSFQPIPTVDTINDHTGFYILTGFIILFYLLLCQSDEWDKIKLFLLMSIPVCAIGMVSWNTGSITEYANTKVEATFVKFEAERHNETRSQGKTTSVVTVRNLYVVYEVQEKNIILPASQGVEYPKTAILYKN